MIIGQYLCECVQCGNLSWEFDGDSFTCPKCKSIAKTILDYAEVDIKEDSQQEIDIQNAKYQ